jgi:hypothetical protein
LSFARESCLCPFPNLAVLMALRVAASLLLLLVQETGPESEKWLLFALPYQFESDAESDAGREGSKL